MSSAIATLYSKISTPKVHATLIALLAFLLPFERIPSFDIVGVTLRASQFVALSLVVVSIISIKNFYKSKPRLPRLLLPAFLFSYFLSVLMASDLKRALTVFVFTVFVVLVGSAIAATLKADQLPKVEKYLFIATSIVLAFGFYQYFGDVFGLNPAYTGLRSIYTKEIFGFPRIQSTALEPLYYGSFLLIPYCLLLAKRLFGPKTITTFHTVLLVLIIAQVLLTVSRGAIYSGILATIILVAYLLVSKKTTFKQVGKFFAVAVLGCAVGLAMTWMPSYFIRDSQSAETKTEKLLDQTSNFESQADRVRNRELAVSAFKENPLLGIGPGNFSQYAVARLPLMLRQRQ